MDVSREQPHTEKHELQDRGFGSFGLNLAASLCSGGKLVTSGAHTCAETNQVQMAIDVLGEHSDMRAHVMQGSAVDLWCRVVLFVLQFCVSVCFPRHSNFSDLARPSESAADGQGAAQVRRNILHD